MSWRGYRNLTPSTYFEQPKLGVLTKTIRSIDTRELNSEIETEGYEGIVLDNDSNNFKMHKGDTIMIPSHHNAVELFGTKYVPVLANNDYGQTLSTLMKETDFKNYVVSGEGHKMEYNGCINYQKNGRVYSKETDVYKAAKIESRKLKSAKRRKSYEKSLINDLKDNKKMTVLYGLN